MVDIIKVRVVLEKNYKDKAWEIPDAAISYSEVNWIDKDIAPTDAEIETQYQDIVDNSYKTEHSRNRKPVYPSTDSLVVALWEKLVELDGLSSTAIDEIQEERVSIKEKFPKLIAKLDTPLQGAVAVEEDTFT